MNDQNANSRPSGLLVLMKLMIFFGDLHFSFWWRMGGGGAQSVKPRTGSEKRKVSWDPFKETTDHDHLSTLHYSGSSVLLSKEHPVFYVFHLLLLLLVTYLFLPPVSSSLFAYCPATRLPPHPPPNPCVCVPIFYNNHKITYVPLNTTLSECFRVGTISWPRRQVTVTRLTFL